MSTELFEKVKKYQNITTHIRNRSVHSLKSKMGWKGIGSKEDPIIVDNVEGLKPTLIFATHDVYFVIKNIVAYKIVCKRTENITIENCKIYELDVQGSYNMNIINNAILSLKIIFLRESVVKNNGIRQHNVSAINELERRMKISVGGITCVLAMMLFLVFYIPYNDVSYWWLSVLFAFICIGLICMLNLFSSGWRRTRAKVDNTIDANYTITDTRSLLYEVFTFYKHFQNKRYLYYKIGWSLLGMIIGGVIIAVVFWMYYNFYVLPHL